MRKQTVFALFCLCLSGMLEAQEPKDAGPSSNFKLHPEASGSNSTRAVVIGISDYQDPAIPDLQYAHRDAEAFANFLRSPAGGLLDNDHLKVLTNEKATAGRIAEAFDALIEQAAAGDQVIIYFSGHGDVERKTVTQPGFLLCWDAPSRVYMGGGTYSLAFLQEIVTTLSTQNGAKVVVITDACHAGKLSGSQIGGAQLTSANLARQYANEVKILSCQPNEFSLEGEQWGGGRGCFSYHLIDGLFGLADRNEDDLVTVGELDRYLEDHVTSEAAPQSQVPMVLGNKSERLALVNAAVLANLKKIKSGEMPFFTPTYSRGLEDEVLSKVDTSIREMYLTFKQTVQEMQFFEPAGHCAEDFYAQLLQLEAMIPLRAIMKRNYAAALQDGAQQMMNTMLKTGLTIDVLSGKKASELYRNYPAWLNRAAEILGSGHYMYAELQARKSFFEGKIQLKHAESRKYLLKALSWQPELPHAFVELISTCSAAEADSAEIFAKKAIELVPQWVVPYIRLAAFYEGRMFNPEKTEALLEQASAVDSNSLLLWYYKARFYERRKDTEKAEHWYKKVVASSNEGICFPCAHLHLGNTYISAGRYAEAEANFLKAIQLDSSFMMPYNGLGTVYRLTDRFEASEAAYKKSIQTTLYEKDKAPTYNEMGNLYSNMKRMEEAEKYYKKAIQADSTFLNSYVNLGAVYTNSGRHAEAENLYQSGLRINPTFGGILYNFAWLQGIQGRVDQAFDMLDRALRFGKGYDYDWMQQDPDFAPLRERAEQWKTLMKKYFPDKAKD